MKNKTVFLMASGLIFFMWALWNYEVSLELLEKFIGIIMPFIIGCSLAFVVNVLLEKIELGWDKLFKPHKITGFLKRPVCILLSIALILAVCIFTVVLVIPELSSSIKTFVKLVPPAMIRFNEYLQAKIISLNLSEDDIAYITQQWKEVYSSLVNFIKNNKGFFVTKTWNIATDFVYMTTDIVIGIVVAVYILLEKEFLARSTCRVIYAFCSRQRAEYLVQAGGLAKKIFSGFVGGQVMEAIVLGIMCFAGMELTGLPYAVVISVLVAVMALIPILGTFISAVVGCFLTAVAEPDKIWLFILFFFILQRIEGDILYPKIVGKAVGLSELYVLAAITVGGSIGGIIGIVVSVPVFSFVYQLISQRVQVLLDEKKLQDL